jgi:cytochrome c-type biogenesis protein CcmE
VDLSPRSITDTTDTPPPRRRRTNRAALALLALVVVAGGVIVTRFLTSALDYYCNADELNVTSSCSGDKRIRVQGTVDRGSVVSGAGETRFSISFNGVSVPVVYDGQPGGIFQECIPVVVRGRLGDGGVFLGDQVEVKHSNEYEEDNADRLSEAETEAAACSQA